MKGSYEIHSDLDALSHAAAERFVALGRDCLATQGGRFNVALAGGGTPACLYRLLTEPRYREALDWSRVEFYFGDERAVPHSHSDSNYRMARETLLDHLPIGAKQVHPFDTSLDVRKAAAEYARLLHRTLPAEQGLPRFDLILLGMGADGHTASLFPNTCILHDERLAAAVYVAKLKSWRLSLTLPVINNADHVILLVSGENKAPVLHELNTDPHCPYPVNRVKPRGELLWLLDKAAASQMEGPG